MSISRRPMLKAAASAVMSGGVVALCGAPGAFTAPARPQITGRIVNWTGEIPYGWIGGNAEIIERLLADPFFERIRPLIEWLLTQAIHMDAVLALYADLDTGTSKTAPIITVNEIELDFTLSEKSPRTKFKDRLRILFEKNEPSGTQTTTEPERLTRTDGFPAYMWSYRIRRPDGATYYAAYHLVDRGSDKAHAFTLKADGQKYQMRLHEFDQLVRSVRY
jgi:hypothetical protein